MWGGVGIRGNIRKELLVVCFDDHFEGKKKTIDGVIKTPIGQEIIAHKYQWSINEGKMSVMHECHPCISENKVKPNYKCVLCWKYEVRGGSEEKGHMCMPRDKDKTGQGGSVVMIRSKRK